MQCHCLRGQSFQIEPPPSAASTFVFLTIFGRTDLRISLSKAKFDPEADFDVRFAVARQNPRQISKKRNCRSEIFADFFLAKTSDENFRLLLIWRGFWRATAKGTSKSAFKFRFRQTYSEVCATKYCQKTNVEAADGGGSIVKL